MNKSTFIRGSLALLASTLVLGVGVSYKVNAALLGSGSKHDPFRILSCGDLQSMKESPESHYEIKRDIDCSDTAKWDVDDCLTIMDKKTCSKKKSGCVWIKENKCEDEFFIGCASDANDCSEYCEGHWTQTGSCHDVSGFEPIGKMSKPFSGSLNGGGFTISDLNISRPGSDGVGLIGWSDRAVLQDVNLKNARVTGSDTVGTAIGNMNEGSIEAVRVEGSSVSGVWGVGGLVGFARLNETGSVIRSTASYNCDIEGEAAIGGIVGSVDGGVLEESASVGSIIRGTYGGGGLGGIADNTSITDVYAESDIYVNKQAGGGFGTLYGKSNMTRAISFGKVLCFEKTANEVSDKSKTICEVEDGGGLVGAEGKKAKVRKSHYSLARSGMTDKGKGKGLTDDELKNAKKYKTWDWDRTWKKKENGMPYLLSLPKPPPRKIVHTAAPKETLVEKKGVAVGILYKKNNKIDIKPKMIALSVDGSAVVARSKTDKKGRFKFENLDIENGAFVTVFVEEDPDYRAMTIIRKQSDALPNLRLVRKSILLLGDSKIESKISTKDISNATINGGFGNSTIDLMLSVDGNDIEILEGNELHIGANVTLELNGDLNTDNLILEGSLIQDKYRVTVNGSYTQLDGLFIAGSNDTVFDGDIIIKGGEFRGSKGTVKFTDDLVGKFRLESGSFISPKNLEVSTDWFQKEGNFKHNESTVIIKGTSHAFDFPKKEKFYNVIIKKVDDTAIVMEKNDSMIVENRLELVDGVVRGGRLKALGDVDQGSSFDGGTMELRLEGSKKRTVQINAGGKVPKIRLDSKNTTVRLKAANLKDQDNPERESHIFEYPVKILDGKFIVEGGNMWTYSKLELKGGSFELRSGSLIANNQVKIEGGEMIADGGVITLNANLNISGGMLFVRDAIFNANDKVKIYDGELRGGRKKMVFNEDLELHGGKFVGSSNDMHFYGDVEKVKGKFFHNGGKVMLKGRTSKLDMDKEEFGHLIINKHQTSSIKIEEGTTVVVRGDLVVLSGTPKNGSFSVYGNVTYSPMVETGSTSLNFMGHKTQELKFANPTRFQGDLIINKDGDGIVKLMSAVHLLEKNQKIQLRSGILDTNEQDIMNDKKTEIIISKGATFMKRGTGDHPKLNLKDGSTVHYKLGSGIAKLDDIEYKNLILESDKGLTFYPPKTGLVVKNDLKIISGVLELKENQTIRIGGSWLNEKGKFKSGNGKVSFVGPVSRITGDNTFYDLEKIVPPNKDGILIVDSGTEQRVNGMLRLKGDKCKFLKVHSSIDGKPWTLIPMGGVEIQSLYVSGMNYDHLIEGECTEDCIDGGGNKKIKFKSNQCRAPSTKCGNGILEKPYEKCDDGNVMRKDGCSPFCTIEDGFMCIGTSKSECKPVCGNGILSGSEECDDKNNNDNDGCSKICKMEEGFVCGGEPSVCLPMCGDGIKHGSEECDDKNRRSGDGCSEFCEIEQGYSCTGKKKSQCSQSCGNGEKSKSEECDDGNIMNSDGCSNKCIIETGFQCLIAGESCVNVCGDGLVRRNEQCDDGNKDLNDGCNNVCLMESGFVCKGEPSECNPICGMKDYDPNKCPKGVSFTVNMRGKNVAPPVLTDVTGDAIFALQKDKKLQYSINVSESLRGTIGIYLGGYGETGKEIIRLVSVNGETRSLTDQEVINLYSNKLYLNISTDEHPSGIIRGQLERL